MSDHPEQLALYGVVVNRGDGEKVIAIARNAGLAGATVFYATGTSTFGFFASFGLGDVQKEVVLMAAGTDAGDRAALAIVEGLSLRKPRRGILFAIPLAAVYGSTLLSPHSKSPLKEQTMEYQAIFTIVEKGNAELVIDAAAAAGATGGTIINARGAGIHDTKRIFKIPIEPEKEIVLTIAPTVKAEAIAQAIRTRLHIDEPGKGIIFVTDVQSAYGLVK